MGVIDHECPGCGATIVFNPKNQNWVCGYCNNEYKIEDFKKYTKRENEGDKKSISTVFKCASCGSTVATDKHTSATYCVYCGSTAINKKRLSGDFSPSKIIPFKLSKEDAISKFLDMQNKYKFMPKLFNKKENIDKIYGMYVPFWFFDVNTVGIVKAIAYKYYGPGDPDSSGFYKEVYELVREGKFKFENIPVDASLKLDDDLMYSLGPFNYDEMTQYNHAYLSGFFSEINSISDKECFEKLKPLFEDACIKVIRSREIKYSLVDPYDVKMEFKELKKKCVLIPVWLVNVKYDNKNFLLAINGQTGKVVGDVPFNKYKFTIFAIFFLMIFCIIVLLIKEVFLL